MIIIKIILILLLILVLFFNINNKMTYENYRNLEFSEFNKIPNNLNEIFKITNLNLNAYPNVKVKGGEELFKDNKFLPECCIYYSDYSTDKGCPCITGEQQGYLLKRGNNRNTDSFIEGKYEKTLFFSPSNTFKQDKENIFIKHDVYFKKDEEPLSDASKNYVYSKLYELKR